MGNMITPNASPPGFAPTTPLTHCAKTTPASPANFSAAPQIANRDAVMLELYQTTLAAFLRPNAMVLVQVVELVVPVPTPTMVALATPQVPSAPAAMNMNVAAT